MPPLITDSVLIAALAGVAAWYAADRQKPSVLWDATRGQWHTTAHSAQTVGMLAAAATWWWAQSQVGEGPPTNSFGAITLGDLSGGASDFDNEGMFRAGTMQLEDLL